MSGAWKLSMVTGDFGSTQIHVLRDYVCLRCIKGYESTAKAKACVANRTWAPYSLVSLFFEVAQVGASAELCLNTSCCYVIANLTSLCADSRVVC